MAFEKRSYYENGKSPKTPDRCVYCGTAFTEYIPKHEQQFPEFQREQVQPTKDHLLPKSQNGILSKRNKVFACESCNAMKGNLLPDQFLMVMESMVIATKHSHQREISRLKRIMTNVRQICNQRLPGSTNGNR